MKKDLNEIINIIRTAIPYIKSIYGVSSIEVFGSYVKNQNNRNSDLDLLVTYSKTPSLLKFIELKNYLTDLLQIEVDLVMKNSLKPGLRQNILNESISL